MRALVGEQNDVALRETALGWLHLAKKHVTNRSARVAVFAYALRAALDDLSPDERAQMLALAVAEVQR